MNRNNTRRRFALAWWWQLVLTLAPLFVISGAFDGKNAILPVLAMPFFVAGLLSMFVSLRPFGRYKHALIATGAARDTPEEAAAWIALADARRVAFLAAGLPAWIAALAVFVGLETVPLLLLAFSSVVLLYLYRIPRQLA
ncbi:MFS transporter [Pseudomonas sp. S25]|uniref:MFS transporter n=1 Tax=Pseudomonas maioricensis TaxID=1766623 RepID=A0ABS9ZM69_9PSED|nr:MFS transporter [Pseudomonas sp. S25]MCI8211670.1 MFS transporter [Pseudomonas sp. S25]